ncbi:MAG: tyrosine-type recombinase/integrase [Peptostreptococcaceae bacterium]|nr:tyrosine-type recombinase/integrase [Peptostreptococcaceae bacterium]
MNIYEQFENRMRDLYGMSEKTLEVYMINLREFNKYMFKDKIATIEDIKGLTSDDIMIKWLKVKEKEGISAASLNQRIASLSRFYTYYVGIQKININVAKSLNNFKSKVKKEKEILTLEESQRLLDKARSISNENPILRNVRNELIISLFLGCGLRIEELSELRTSNFDLDRRELNLSFTKFGKPRAVSIPSPILSSYKKYMELRNEKYIDLDKSLKDVIFISKKRNKLSTDQIRRVVYQLIKEANVTRVTPHALRHGFGTLMLATGKLTLEELSLEMGHSDISTTLKWYVHQVKDKNYGDINPVFNKGEV